MPLASISTSGTTRPNTEPQRTQRAQRNHLTPRPLQQAGEGAWMIAVPSPSPPEFWGDKGTLEAQQRDGVRGAPLCWVEVLITIDSKISLLDSAAGADLGRGSGFEHPAVDHDGERIGYCEHGIHVVFDEQDGVILCEFAQQRDDAQGFVGAHAGKRFVEQQHAPARRQRHGDLNLALLAMRQRRHHRLSAVRQPSLRKYLADGYIDVFTYNH